jgi:hypothetical protein
MASAHIETEITDLEEATWRALQKSGEGMLPFITTYATSLVTNTRPSPTNSPAAATV